MYIVENYKTQNNPTQEYRVLVVKLTSPDQVLTSENDSIHQIIKKVNLSESVGIYFYRFKNLDTAAAFSKIGEVSRKEGLIERKFRGWIAAPSYGDSYRKKNKKGVEKGIFSDVKIISEENPMYFVFYELDVKSAFPKIDEIHAFSKHVEKFGYSTRNKESANTFSDLGSNLVWHSPAFDEVLALKLPSGASYP